MHFGGSYGTYLDAVASLQACIAAFPFALAAIAADDRAADHDDPLHPPPALQLVAERSAGRQRAEQVPPYLL